MPNRFISERGAPRYPAGCLTRSDNHSTIGVYALGTPTYAQSAATALSAVITLNTTNIVLIALTGFTQRVIAINFEVGATIAPDLIISRINLSLETASMTASGGSTAGQLIVTSTVPGSAGNFTLSVNGTPIVVTASVDNPPIRTGRIVVPVTDNIDVGLERYDTMQRYRLPSINDNTNLLRAGGISIKDYHTNFVFDNLFSDDSQLRQGTPFAVLKRGYITMRAFSAIPANSFTLFVNGIEAGLDLAGTLTVTATANTIAVPPGFINIAAGADAGRVIEVQKLAG